MAAQGKKILETARLSLREITTDDAEFFFLLNSDPEVMRYTGDSAFKDIADAERFIVRYDQYRRYGIGRWAAVDKRSAKILGWCGLKYSAEVDEYDLGFRFFREYWNKGFATEAGRASVEFGLKEKKLATIVGRAMKANTASIRVLSKIGLSYWKENACGNEEGVIYKIENPDRMGLL